jgi:hypothetical protein
MSSFSLRNYTKRIPTIGKMGARTPPFVPPGGPIGSDDINSNPQPLDNSISNNDFSLDDDDNPDWGDNTTVTVTKPPQAKGQGNTTGSAARDYDRMLREGPGKAGVLRSIAAGGVGFLGGFVNADRRFGGGIDQGTLNNAAEEIKHPGWRGGLARAKERADLEGEDEVKKERQREFNERQQIRADRQRELEANNQRLANDRGDKLDANKEYRNARMAEKDKENIGKYLKDGWKEVLPGEEGDVDNTWEVREYKNSDGSVVKIARPGREVREGLGELPSPVVKMLKDKGYAVPDGKLTPKQRQEFVNIYQTITKDDRAGKGQVIQQERVDKMGQGKARPDITSRREVIQTEKKKAAENAGYAKATKQFEFDMAKLDADYQKAHANDPQQFQNRHNDPAYLALKDQAQKKLQANKKMVSKTFGTGVEYPDLDPKTGQPIANPQKVMQKVSQVADNVTGTAAPIAPPKQIIDKAPVGKAIVSPDGKFYWIKNADGSLEGPKEKK